MYSTATTQKNTFAHFHIASPIEGPVATNGRVTVGTGQGF